MNELKELDKKILDLQEKLLNAASNGTPQFLISQIREDLYFLKLKRQELSSGQTVQR